MASASSKAFERVLDKKDFGVLLSESSIASTLEWSEVNVQLPQITGSTPNSRAPALGRAVPLSEHVDF